MSTYEIVKVLHIVSATVLFGTGIGTAFVVWRADRSGEVAAIAFASRHAVIADWLFTTPAVVFQPVSGLWLAHLAGYDLAEPWLVWSYALYALVGACWLRVVWLQIRLRRLAAHAAAHAAPLPEDYRRSMRAWFVLGWPAFLALLVIFWLMVAKP